MRKITFCLLLGFALVACNQNNKNYTKYVNPFIGTTNGGNQNPGARVPFGMVEFCPYNYADSFPDPAVYMQGQKTIYGFGLTNLTGSGCASYGSILLMPVVGEGVDMLKHHSAYKNEIAEPGYYSVDLSDFNVKAELTASLRSCYGEFKFPKGNGSFVVDISRTNTQDTAFFLESVSASEIRGYRTDGQFCGKPGVHKAYFYIRFSKPSVKIDFYKNDQLVNNKEIKSSNEKLKAVYRFETSENESIEVKAAVSYVSMTNALENLDKEIGAKSFAQVKKEASETWNNMLSRIEVQDTSMEKLTKFYTAIYHTMSHPNIIDDINGQYPAMEKDSVCQLKSGHRYSVFSLWDTYRTVHPFFSLVYPEIQSDIVKTMLSMSAEYGWLPHWEAIGHEKGVMNGDPSLIVINDSYQKGIKDFDTKKALNAMLWNTSHVYYKAEADRPMVAYIRKGMEPYNKNNGYIPYDYKHNGGDVWGSVSTTLEYNLADWNLAQFAKSTGNDDIYKKYNERSHGWQYLFDPATGFIRERKSDGSWPEKFDPLERSGEMSWPFSGGPGYTEGDAWHYTFFVPHDIEKLKEMMGGDSAYVKKLKECFDKGLYMPDNEPDIAYPFLFNYVKGQEWLTQETVNKVIATNFGIKPGSIPGNDDTGTMSAWLIFAMMGIYPDCPGKPDYQLETPSFNKITIHLNQKYYKGKDFVIETTGDKGGRYIKSMKVNGKPYSMYSIPHTTIVNGGTWSVEKGNNK
jgi:predicted alpha-1,2-mannosidase